MLEFWLTSSVICLFVLYVTSISIVAQAKREGYTIRKQPYSNFEIIRGSFPMFVPIFNMILALVLIIFYDQIYKAGIKNLIASGDIIKPEA